MTTVETWEARRIVLRRSPTLAAWLVGLGVVVFSPLAFILFGSAWEHGPAGLRPAEVLLRTWAPTVVSLCFLWFITSPQYRLRMSVAVLAASSFASACYLSSLSRYGPVLIEIPRAALLGIFLPFAFFEKLDWWRMPPVTTLRFIFYFSITAFSLGSLCGIVTSGLAENLGLANYTPSFVAGYSGGLAGLIARCILYLESSPE
jgi:hypothetical protein